jgi:hypothetical protein
MQQCQCAQPAEERGLPRCRDRGHYLGDNPDPFRVYHKASSGPASEYRPIFGEVRGSDYKEYFGKTIPALCVYPKKGDRAPVEVLPRMDHKLGRVYLIEEWLENYVAELEGRIEATK